MSRYSIQTITVLNKINFNFSTIFNIQLDVNFNRANIVNIF